MQTTHQQTIHGTFTQFIIQFEAKQALQSKLLNNEINPHTFVSMDCSELASSKLAKLRTLNKQAELKKIQTIADNSDNWIDCAVQFVNCKHNKCKYKLKKMMIESSKCAVFGGISSKQQNVDMICKKCGYSFEYEMST